MTPHDNWIASADVLVRIPADGSKVKPVMVKDLIGFNAFYRLLKDGTQYLRLTRRTNGTTS